MGRVRSAQQNKKKKIKFYTQHQAALKLQLPLKLFRKLCILKGVFPREPKIRVGRDTIYYSHKDVKYMLHDPLIDTFREHASWKKRVVKAKVRKDKIKAARLMLKKPVSKLDHMIKDRYPTFVSALRDLDDALTLIFSFSRLSSFDDYSEPEDRARLARCQQLCLEWESYIAHTRCLTKSFISVKGIYFRAIVYGETITWLVPHQFAHTIPDHVNADVMMSFLQIFETMLRFVMFKLFNEAGLSYPPKIDNEKTLQGIKMGSVILSSNRETENGEKQDITEEEAAVFGLPKEEIHQGKGTENLFKGLKFFVSREVPNEAVELIIRSCGGLVSFENSAAPFPETDESITHQIVDRPSQRHLFLSRTYVQPQWIFDCLNAGFLLPVSEYLVGLQCPPHLSPFVDLQRADYVPLRAQEIENLRQQFKETKAAELKPYLSDDDDQDNASDSDNDDTLFMKELQTEMEAYGKNKMLDLQSAASMSTEGLVLAAKQRRLKKAAREREEKLEETRLAETLIKGKKKRIYRAIKRNERDRVQRIQALLAKRG